MRERSTYEKSIEIPQTGSKTIMLFYSSGISPEILLESLVRRELLYKRLTRVPNDPRVSRDVKNRLIITGE